MQKESQNTSSQQRELYSLGILEVIIGAGVCFGTLVSRSLTDISYILWAEFVRNGIFVVSILGFLFVVIFYISKSKHGWTRGKLIFSLSAGISATGCLTAISCKTLEPKISSLLIIFFAGISFVLTGIAIFLRSNWSETLQRTVCVLFTAGMLFLFNASWRNTPTLFSVLFLLLAFPPIYSAVTLADRAERRTRIGIRFFCFTLLFFWAFVLVVAIPNIVNAENRDRQKTTMWHLRIIAITVDSYALDHNSYPPTMSIDDLSKLLEPKYVKAMPKEDGWHHPIEYYGIAFQNNRFEGYVIRSAGRDGKFEQKDPTAYKDGPVKGFERDLVFSIGSMSQWPSGSMPP